MELTETRDGSWTCFNPETGEHYHNLHGALTEAVEVYVNPSCLAERLTKSPHLRLLDPFFGMGYNTLACIAAFMALRQSGFPNARLTVLAIEYDEKILAVSRALIEKGILNLAKDFSGAFVHKIYYQTQAPPLFGGD